MQPRFFWIRSVFAVAFVLAMGATCQPPADTDGLRTGAASIGLGDPRSDQLWCPSGCGGKGGDCADWWQVPVTKCGKLHVQVANAPTSERDGKTREVDARAGIVLKLVDGGGADLGRAEAVGTAPGALSAKVAPGNYFLLVEPLDPKRAGAQPYTVKAHLELPKPKPEPRPEPVTEPVSPPPPPPEPRFQTLTTPILELEGPVGRPTAVLLDGGHSAGLRVGLQGRIVDGGRIIAPVEIVQVFDGGSRARIVGPMAGRITPSSGVEIDVPVGGP